MEKQDFPEKIRYHYQTDPGAHLQISHGVWGGVNPHGEIELCFYHESDIPPLVSEQLVSPDGSAGPERINQEDGCRHIARQIHTRILVNYNTARALLDWLEERLAELDSEGASEIYDFNSGIRQ